MKKNLVLFSALLFITLISIASTNFVIPESVKEAFRLKYPNAEGVEWANHKTLFTAEFEDEDGYYKTVSFDENAIWLKTEFEVNDIDIPEKIRSNIASIYKEFEYFSSSMQLEEPSGIYFILAFENGEEDLVLKFNEDGELLEKIVNPEEDEEDEEDDNGDDG